MNLKTLAAAMNIAWAVSRVDGMEDKETTVLAKEMKSFNLNEDQVHTVLEQYKQMDPIEAINILRAADEATRKEAQALTMVTIGADGEISDKEVGAYSLMANLCSFIKISWEEAHQILGF